jgi:hypothetical protein
MAIREVHCRRRATRVDGVGGEDLRGYSVATRRGRLWHVVETATYRGSPPHLAGLPRERGYGSAVREFRAIQAVVDRADTS